VADVNEDLPRLRPPRFLHPDGVVRPYQRYQAEGDSLLKVKHLVDKVKELIAKKKGKQASLKVATTFPLH
jgi:hypothetical protein